MGATTTPTTVPEALAARAAERPDDVAAALVGGEQLTFAQWEERANAAARGLIGRGVKPRDRVLLPCDTHDWVDLAVAYVAVQKLAAVAVPVSTRMGLHHLAATAVAAGAVGAVGSGAAELAPPCGWSATVAELRRGRATHALRSLAAADDPAEILYTSGTTGRPKGVVATHASVLHAHLRPRARREPRRVLHPLTPATTAGQGLLVQPLGAAPHTVLTLPDYDDAALVAAIERERPTDLVLVPALVLSLIRSAAARTADLSSVRMVRTTSAPIAPAALAQLDALFPRAATYNMYATTESWPARARMRFDPSRPGAVGRADGGSAIRVVDESGASAPPEVVGDVQLNLAGAPQRHYDGDPEATAAVFLPGGWVRTGDAGYLDADGYLHLVDRHADLVVSGGLNISTIEVEAALHEHPEIVEAAVFGIPHPSLGEVVAAALRVTPAFDLAALNVFTEARLGPKAPKRVVVVEQLPRNALGKVLKRELRERHAVAGQRAVSAAPATATERALAHFWEETLALDGVGRDDDFLALGGTSLSAMEVVARVRAELGRTISQRELFETTTLADLAARVDAAPEATAPAAGGIATIPRVARRR